MLLTPLCPLPQPTTVSGTPSSLTSPNMTLSTWEAEVENEPMLVHTPSFFSINMIFTPVEEASAFW